MGSIRIRGKKERKENIRAFIDDYKSNLKCEECSEDHSSVLDFHHNDPSEKEIGISEVYKQGWGQERILKEIEKCIVLCSNCHRKLHYNLNNSQ